jgi:serine/threonine protein kinase
MDNYVGKRLDGRYELQEVIGMGGMANVYRSYDTTEEKLVAIKILKDEYSNNDEFVRRFRNESKAIALLSHVNIVKVFDVSFGKKIQYIVMEFVDGITLKEYIEEQKVVNWKEAIHFTIQILKALQHAHDKGIVHRDIKPQNIMLLKDGTIKVMDFGIARFAREEGRTLSSQAIGSVHYISPEQARAETTDEKTDIYSVGVMMFEMLTGTLPFDADSAVSVALMQLQNTPKKPSEINEDIPLGLEEIIIRAMQKDSSKRYQSASEMLRDINMFKGNPTMVFDYKYFNDEKTTKFFEAVTSDKEQEEPEEKSNLIPILAGVAVAFVVVATIVIISMGAISGWFKPVKEVVVPKLVGLNYNNVIKDEKYKDIRIQFETTKFNDEYDAGIIYEQSEKEGSKVKKNYIVKVKVSKGKVIVTIPDLYKQHTAEAEEQLQKLGLEVKIEKIQDEEIVKDFVVKTLPARGAQVAKGSQVTLYVSSGKEIIYTTVPNVIDKNEDEAKNQIEAFKLKVGTVTPVDSTKKAGIVVSQSISGGAKIGEGSTVNLEVSSGNAPSKTTEVKVKNLPTDATGTYKFKVYLAGQEITNLAKTIDVSTTSSVSFDVSSSGTKEVTIKIEKSGSEAILSKNSVNFTTGISDETFRNDNSFKLVDLYIAIAKASTLKSSDYTEESWSTYSSALQEAKLIRTSDTATKISAALSKLNTAFNNLKK